MPKSLRSPKRLLKVPVERAYSSVVGDAGEQIAYRWLQQRRKSFDFETSLLAGRPELGFVDAPIIWGSQVLRVNDQIDAKLEIEGIILGDYGLNVTDISWAELIQDKEAVMKGIVG